MVCMFQHNSSHSKVKAENRKLVVNRMTMAIFQERDSTHIKWDDAGTEYVVESTGFFTTMEVARAHLRGRPEGIISAPSTNTPMVVMRVNHEKYDSSLKIASNASCTTNSLTPLAKVIHNKFGIVEEIMTTVHAITASQKLWMVPLGSYGMMAMGCPEYHPCIQWCTKIIQKVILELNGKLTGMAFCVPIHKASALDLTYHLEKATKYEDMENAGILAPTKGHPG